MNGEEESVRRGREEHVRRGREERVRKEREKQLLYLLFLSWLPPW